MFGEYGKQTGVTSCKMQNNCTKWRLGGRPYRTILLLVSKISTSLPLRKRASSRTIYPGPAYTVVVSGCRDLELASTPHSLPTSFSLFRLPSVYGWLLLLIV